MRPSPGISHHASTDLGNRSPAHSPTPSPREGYVATVYNGLDLAQSTFRPEPGDFLVFLGRVSWKKGTHLAIEIARKAGVPLKIAAHIPDDERDYFDSIVSPALGGSIEFVGEVGPPCATGRPDSS